MKINYFQASEFGGWYDQLSLELLLKLDVFRHLWGAQVAVSRAPGAVGRRDFSESQHNINLWGEVRAVDLFPMCIHSDTRHCTQANDRLRMFNVARRAGFTGIGLYTDTHPGNMLHVDVRKDRQVSAPATWAREKKEYVAITKVLPPGEIVT